MKRIRFAAIGALRLGKIRVAFLIIGAFLSLALIQRPVLAEQTLDAKLVFHAIKSLDDTEILPDLYVSQYFLSLQRIQNRSLDLQCDYGVGLRVGELSGKVTTSYRCRPLNFKDRCEVRLTYAQLNSGQAFPINWQACRGPDHHAGAGTVGVGTLEIDPSWVQDEDSGSILDESGVPYPDTLEIDYDYDYRRIGLEWE